MKKPGDAPSVCAFHDRLEPGRLSRLFDVTAAEEHRVEADQTIVLGSGDVEETAQAAWLETVMEGAGGRGIAWFFHRPLFLDSPGEGDTGYWSVKPQPRARLIELVKRYSVTLVASGHLHKSHRMNHQGTCYVWAPASSFLVGPEIQPPMAGEKRLGAVIYELDGTALGVEITEVPGLSPHWIDDVIDQVYPRAPLA
jgi:alkaline phosphatase D